MNEATYLELTMRNRNDGIRFARFLGPKWIVMKIVISVIAVLCLLDQDSVSNAFGWLTVGYLVSVISMSIRLYYRNLRMWPVYEKYLNWDLIEAQLEETAKEPAGDTNS